MTLDHSVESWAEEFKPVLNHLDENASWSGYSDDEDEDYPERGIMFETYGAELEFVLSQPEENVWTYMDGEEGGTIICAGYHLVNRIGYFITKVAREPELEDMSNHICITVSTDEENEDD